MTPDCRPQLRETSRWARSGFCPGDDGHEVMFTSIAFFTGLKAVRAFAGDDYERAVVAPDARCALSRWDERVSRHEVVIVLQ